MALYPKNPENNVVEKFALWFMKTVGVASIVLGICTFYVFIPKVTSNQVILGWSILSITIAIDEVVLGIGLLVYYKKSLSAFSRLWILIPMLILFAAVFFRNFIYYEPTIRRVTSEVVCVVVILFLIFSWFYYRKKYPEEFGLQS